MSLEEDMRRDELKREIERLHNEIENGNKHRLRLFRKNISTFTLEVIRFECDRLVDKHIKQNHALKPTKETCIGIHEAVLGFYMDEDTQIQAIMQNAPWIICDIDQDKDWPESAPAALIIQEDLHIHVEQAFNTIVDSLGRVFRNFDLLPTSITGASPWYIDEVSWRIVTLYQKLILNTRDHWKLIGATNSYAKEIHKALSNRDQLLRLSDQLGQNSIGTMLEDL